MRIKQVLLEKRADSRKGVAGCDRVIIKKINYQRGLNQ